MNRMGMATALALLLHLPAYAHGQSLSAEVPEDLTFRIQSQLVQIYLTVTNGSRHVDGLSASDFGLFEDGARKSPARLDTGEVPLRVALLLDTSGSMREALPVTQAAAIDFVESLSSKDRVALIPFNSDVRIFPQITDSKTGIVDAIREAQAIGGTKLYEALLFAMKHLAGKEGRKAIVVFSDGEDTAQSSSINIVLNAAARYGFPIYTIGAGSGLQRDALKRVLRKLAEINSGKTYLVSKPSRLRDAFAEVSKELRAAYVLNYYTRVPFDGRWHDIRIQLANKRYKIHSRKGFYARSGGAKGLMMEDSDAKRSVPDILYGASAPAEQASSAAAQEILQAPSPMKSVDMAALPSVAKARSVQARVRASQKRQQKRPVYKVEAKFVEVPVLVESTRRRELEDLKKKDFRIYENDLIKKVAFFRQDWSTENVLELRDEALKSVTPRDEKISLSPDSRSLLLGRVYVVLDDLMTETGAFLHAKQAAEQILREVHSPIRPVSIHFTSRSSSNVGSNDDLESMVSQVRKATPRIAPSLVNDNEFMSVYQAYLVERRDTQATQLAELRYASMMRFRHENMLGSVQGEELISPEMIEQAVQSKSVELVNLNRNMVFRTIDSLRSIVNAAAAEPRDHPKLIMLFSNGFSVGRTSMRADMGRPLEDLVELANSRGIRIDSYDASGLSAEPMLGIRATGSFLVTNSHLSSVMLQYASSWRSDRQSPLLQLAKETGGRFVINENDLAGVAVKAAKASGHLYYLGYLSRQPTDGRVHRIRVTTSKPWYKVRARTSYRASPASATQKPQVEASAEDWEALIERANVARKENNVPELEHVLSKLVRRFSGEAVLWFNLGVAQLELGKALEASESLQKAFTLVPRDPSVGPMLARALVAAGLPAAAIQVLDFMTQQNSESLDLLVQLGRTHESQQNILAAYQAYRRVLDRTATPPLELYVLLTRTSVQLGRHLEARLFIEDFQGRGGDMAKMGSWKLMIPGGNH